MAGVKNVHGLTDKEEKFAQAVAKGSTLTDAFKSCYSWQNYTPDSMWKKASAINNRVDVRERIETLQRENENTEIWTRRNLMERLLRIADEARQAAAQPVLDDKGNVIGVRLDAAAARVELQAAEQAAKIIGVYEQKINARVSSQTIEDYLRSLPDD